MKPVPAHPVSVALSLLTMSPGATGGVETYARELVRAFARFPDLHVTAIVPGNAAGFEPEVAEETVPSIRIGSSTRERLRAIAGIEMTRSALRKRLSRFDVVHFPATVAAPWPDSRQGVVQTIHDMQHIDLPQLFSKAERLYRARYYQGAARRADSVITISEFTRKRLEAGGLAPGIARVIYLGVDHETFSPSTAEREDFVLYPARPWPHKNHAKLIRAMELVRESRPEMELVLTGGGLESLGDLPPWVNRRGLVSEAELVSLYHHAAALAFPSRYEGFGFPLVEAMATGCPVATSGDGALAEIAGDAAVVFDADDERAIAGGILDAVDRSSELSQRGLERAALFTWDACAQAHVDVYADAADRALSRH